MTKTEIFNTIQNERGYIYREENASSYILFNRDNKAICKLPPATVERVKALQGVETWEREYYGEYIAHYFCKEYRQHDNYLRCKREAEEMQAYADGNVYRCPECGKNHYIEDVEKFCCPCGHVGELDQYEQLSLYDYLEAGLDVEYRIGADKTYRSCELTLAWGGPNIYVDTAQNRVKLYWGGEYAEYWISDDLSDRIDDICEEQYESL